MWTGDCVRSKEGLHPTLNILGLGVPSSHISLFLVYCPTTRSLTFLSYCTKGLVTILSLSPQFSSAPDAISKLHPGARWKNRLASAHTHQRTRQVGTPFTPEHDSCSLPLASVAIPTKNRNALWRRISVFYSSLGWYVTKEDDAPHMCWMKTQCYVMGGWEEAPPKSLTVLCCTLLCSRLTVWLRPSGSFCSS